MLAEEAAKCSEDIILELIRKLCKNGELFDKFITVDRFKTGFGQVLRPLKMDNRSWHLPKWLSYILHGITCFPFA